MGNHNKNLSAHGSGLSYFPLSLKPKTVQSLRKVLEWMVLEVFYLLVLILACYHTVAIADEGDEVFSSKKMDGVKIEAVETYANPRNHEIGLTLGLYPFDPYYNGFGVGVGYTHYISNAFAWEVVRGTYMFSVAKDLMSQLAQDWGVNPEAIERLNIIFDTQLIFVPVYGKFVLFQSVIQYFRISLLLGGGVAFTGMENQLFGKAAWGVNFGVRWEVYVSPNFSWKFEVRDMVAFDNGAKNYVSFNFGTGVYF